MYTEEDLIHHKLRLVQTKVAVMMDHLSIIVDNSYFPICIFINKQELEYINIYASMVNKRPVALNAISNIPIIETDKFPTFAVLSKDLILYNPNESRILFSPEKNFHNRLAILKQISADKFQK